MCLLMVKLRAVWTEKMDIVMHFNCQAPVLGTRALHLFGIQDWPLKDAAHTNAQQLLHGECRLAKQSILERKHSRQCQLWGEGELFCWVLFTQIARETSQYEPPPPSSVPGSQLTFSGVPAWLVYNAHWGLVGFQTAALSADKPSWWFSMQCDQHLFHYHNVHLAFAPSVAFTFDWSILHSLDIFLLMSWTLRYRDARDR